jgi:hypothetical protein
LDILSNLGLLEPPDEMETTWDGQNTFKVPPFSGLRGQYFVYVEYATGEVEYYNLANDPYELSNLAALLPAEKLRILREWLDRVRSCQGASCQIAEQVHPGFTP